MQTDHPTFIEKIETRIPGFDFIADGGLPKERITLVSGTAGSAKTVFAAQFLAEGIKNGESGGVFVTFEETPEEIRKNMIGFGWDIAAWEAQDKWAFVDASPRPGEEARIIGDYDLGALLARIDHAVQKVGAHRVSMDSLDAVFTQFPGRSTVRGELLRISSALKKIGVTAVMTAECGEDDGRVSRFGVEEFVVDNVLLLRNALEDEKRRRTVEIIKFRGTGHQKREFPFTVLPNQGVIIIPLSSETTGGCI